MEQYYKLQKVRELAENDQDFIKTVAETFLEEVPSDLESLKQAVKKQDYTNTYQLAHKMKPTIDLFEIGVLHKLIEIQDWGKLVKTNEDISDQLQEVTLAIEKVVAEIKSDFNL